MRQFHVAVAFLVVPWAIVSIATLRPSSADSHVAVDERAAYVAFSRNDHPVTLHDYRATPWAQYGWALRRIAAERRALVLGLPFVSHLRVLNGEPNATSRSPVVASATNIGVLGYAAGPKVHVADQGAIADPIASRLRLEALTFPGGVHISARSRAGHDKLLAPEWIAARFGPAGATALPGVSLSPSWLAAARRALGCPPLRRLTAAVDSPMTFDRFLTNVRQSFSLDRLRFSGSPVRAAQELCSESD
jgi:arabinofuranosyltransferase